MTASRTTRFTIPENFDPRIMSRPEFEHVPPVTLFPGVTSHLDLVYAGPPGYRPLALDLHLPDRIADRRAPVAVYAHGGGFLLGSRRMGPWRFLLEAGVSVASVSYRFSGESVYPAAVHDVAAAVRWVRANADRYRLDPDAIVGFGSSAGAYLISAVALGGDDPSAVGRLGPTPDTSCRLSAVVEHYGPSSFAQMDADAPPDVVEWMDRPGSSISRFLGYVASEQPADAEMASLCSRAHAASPPFLIVHGDDDHRVGIEQSRRLYRALTDAGATAELLEIPGGDHGSAHFDEPPVHEATLSFLRSVLQESMPAEPAPTAST